MNASHKKHRSHINVGKDAGKEEEEEEEEEEVLVGMSVDIYIYITIHLGAKLTSSGNRESRGNSISHPSNYSTFFHDIITTA